jgi:hypothetical protein
MPDHQALARRKREVAEEIRRMARTISSRADRLRLLAQADALDHEAHRLERRASEEKARLQAVDAASPVVRAQPQVQQQKAESDGETEH